MQAFEEGSKLAVLLSGRYASKVQFLSLKSYESVCYESKLVICYTLRRC